MSADSNRSATPDIKDVVLEEGQPLTFVADFETMPAIEPGEYTRHHAAEAAGRPRSRRGRSGARPLAGASRALASGRRPARGRRRHDPGGPHADAAREADQSGRRRAAVARRQGWRAGVAAERDDRDWRAGQPARVRRRADGRVGRRRARTSRSTTRRTTRRPSSAGARMDYAVTVKGFDRRSCCRSTTSSRRK